MQHPDLLHHDHLETSVILEPDVLVLGAGLTGLALSAFLRHRGINSLVIERSDRLGGQIQTLTQGEFVFETGPSTGIISRPEVAELFDLLPDRELMQTALPSSKRRLIYKRGKFHPLPSGGYSAFSTSLFSWRDKLRILGEPWRIAGTNPNESVADLVVRRLGRSYLDYAVDPFVGGVYAGDPHQLVTRYALPKLYALEAQYGSFIRGAIAKMRTPRSDRERRATKQTFSSRGGLSRLVEALAGYVGEEHIVAGAEVESLDLNYQGAAGRPRVVVTTSQGRQLVCLPRYIVSAVGPVELASLLSDAPERCLEPLCAMRYAPIVQVAVGYRKAPVAFDAFGGLIPSSEDPEVLGILNPSAGFQGRAPQGGMLLSVFLGGMRSPNTIHRSDDEITQLVSSRLRQMLGIEQTPDLLHIVRHARAIPQYEASTADRLKAIEELESLYPRLIIGGNMLSGIGMADRIGQAYTIADQLLDKLSIKA